MGLLERLSAAFIQPREQQVEILTKKPGFSVTRFTANNPFTNLIQPESNYYEQYILYTAKSIDYISSKVASTKLKVLSTDTDKEVKGNILFEDLKSFNPYMNIWEARKLVQIHQYITGAAYWYIDRDPMYNKVAEFYPLDPTQMQVKTDSSGLPSHYSYKDGNGRVVELDMDDVIVFRRMDPKNWFQGISHMKTMSFWLNAYAQGAQYNMNKLGNNTNVDKFLVFEDISEEERTRVENQLQNKYKGVKNAGRTGVLNTKPEVIEVSSSQKDLDYVEGMKMLRQDILAGFGIPEALFFPSATNSNSKEARTLFQSDTIEPLIIQETSVYNEQLIRKVDKVSSGKVVAKYYINVPEVVDADKDALVSQVEKLRKSGVFTVDQALEWIGEDPIGGEAGESYMTAAPTAPEDAAAEDKTDLEEGAKKLLLQVKSLNQEIDKLIKERDHADFLTKNIKLAEDQEGIMYNSATGLFFDQFKRINEYLHKTEKISLRAAFDPVVEKQATIMAFKDSYAKVMGNSNNVGNVEIKAKLFAKGSPHFLDFKTKSVSGEATEMLTKKINHFAEELTETSLKKIRKILSAGIEEGFNNDELAEQMNEIFNTYTDGQENIDVLSAKDMYIEAMFIDEKGQAQMNIGNRYSDMFKKITAAKESGEITDSETTDLLKALKGLINPTDPVGKQVDSLLITYGVPQNKGIKRSRSVTIARTESTYARNLGFYDTYKSNPLVSGSTWKSLHDKDVRTAHRDENEVTVEVGEPFDVDGEKMLFPGDTSLGATGKNIVNCRCRITAEVI